ncbi:MAG: glycine oxidase ThiO [Microbacterium sp.]|uniref:glycine oxidase ThiO n=1 Tax=Microbacterium sp. TaxID=51671 RepID=UPI001E0D3A55|nr:glycine oxidase ThiO [Microbacterium sp.]MBW8764218.1 glycine oxidase ThiO [Microbacterium sp.]
MRIAVIGAGIIGLATAEELVVRGHEVTVFDPEPARGASLAAAGMLAHAAEMAWGQDALTPLMQASAEKYPSFVERLSATSGRSLGHRTDGTLSVGVDGADREALGAAAELQRTQGHRAERLTGTAARDLEPALGPAVTSAVFTPDDHQIDPRRLAAALLDLLGDRVRREAVTAVTRTLEGVSGLLSASGEHHRADVVIVAAGLGAALIGGIPALPLRPVWGDVLRLRVPPALRPLITRTVRAQVRGRAVYLVPRDDGTIVLGASVREGGVEGVHAGSVLVLLRDADTVVPGVSECEIVEMLARPRPGSPDAVPLLGVVEEGVVVATGFDRHGVLLAPLAAAVASDLAEGRPIDENVRSAMDPWRFTAATAGGPREAAAWTPPAVVDLVGARPKGS